MRALWIFLLLAGTTFGQIAPPTDTVKKRHGQPATLSWGYTPISTYVLRYFSIKATSDRNVQPVQIATAAPTARSATIVVQFTPQFPKYVYFVVTGINDGPEGRVESLNSNTVEAERIGPPPQ